MPPPEINFLPLCEKGETLKYACVRCLFTVINHKYTSESRDSFVDFSVCFTFYVFLKFFFVRWVLFASKCIAWSDKILYQFYFSSTIICWNRRSRAVMNMLSYNIQKHNNITGKLVTAGCKTKKGVTFVVCSEKINEQRDYKKKYFS